MDAGGQAYDDLDDVYDVWCADVLEDVPFYTGLAGALAAERGVDALDVVELGAGSGRITVPLLATGHRVTAIDASERQLERLATNVGTTMGVPSADGVADGLRIVRGDMRELDALVEPESADLVLAPFRALLHVTADRDAVFAAAHRALRPGGVLAFDVFHASPDQVVAVEGRWLPRRAQRTQRGKWKFQERATYRPAPPGEPGDETLLDVEVRCAWVPLRRTVRRVDETLPADPPAEAAERLAELHLRLAPAESWRESLERTGFTIDGSYGWFDARPLGPRDDDSIWVARRV